MVLLNQILNGLHVGSIYALIALGYTMVYGIVRLINFAHGDIIMVGAYVAFFALTVFQLPFFVAVLLTIAVCVVLGVVIERVAYKPLRNSPRISALITAIGISTLLQNLFAFWFTPTPRAFPDVFHFQPLDVGGMRLSPTTLITIGISLFLMVVLGAFIRTTRTGKAMRAVSEDMNAAQLMGINVNNTISITFAIGSGLAAIGSILYCMSYPQVHPFMGSLPGLKAFVAAVLGGIGILPGAMLGGFLMGIAESMVKSVYSQLTDAVVFGILILVLLVKPSGILGRKVREKV